MSEPQTVRQAIRAAIATLSENKSQSPRLDAEMLMAETLGVRRDRLFAEPERQLTEAESATFAGFVERRGRREPIAYIVGHKAFHKIDLQVNENTLIPRPETETVVEVVLAELKRLDKETPLVLDIGTGCGTIGLALAHEHPKVRVIATEVHPAPLEMARQNATRLGLADRVEFIVSDLFDDVPTEARFDVIVSNPPYVPVEAMRRLRSAATSRTWRCSAASTAWISTCASSRRRRSFCCPAPCSPSRSTTGACSRPCSSFSPRAASRTSTCATTSAVCRG
jgi:release factor glutamine methyltransferase